MWLAALSGAADRDAQHFLSGGTGLACVIDERLAEQRMSFALCHEATSVLQGNWIGTSTIPAHGLYPHQWSWDTAFITYGHAVTNATRARIELDSLFEGQWANGMLPHIVFNPAVPANAYFPGSTYWRSSTDSAGLAPAAPETSGIVNPPVHAGAVLNLARRSMSAEPAETRAFLERIYPKLAASIDFLTRERDPDGNGLYYVRHPWENGMDNSPTWDEALARVEVTPGSIPPYQRADLNPHTDPADRPSNATYDRFVYLMICARNKSYSEAAIARTDGRGCPFLIEDAFFNVLIAQAADAMADLATLTLPQDGGGTTRLAPDDQGKWRALGLGTRRAILRTLWSPSHGMFASRD